MKKIIKIFKAFAKRYKEDMQFRYAVIVISLIIIAIAVNEWRDWEDSKEFPPETVSEEQTEAAETDFLSEIWEDSKLHFFVFGGLTALLAVVKCRNDMRLRESGNAVKK